MTLTTILFWVGATIVGTFLLTVFVGAPFVPSHRLQVQRTFRTLRPLTNYDGVVDLGAGDGRVMQEAMRAGARSVTGVEINPVLWLAARARLHRSARVILGSMWRYTLPPSTTVVYVFGVGRDSEKLVRYMRHESIRLNRSIDLITYGNPLTGEKAVGSLGAHFLYRFTPRQSKALTV